MSKRKAIDDDRLSESGSLTGSTLDADMIVQEIKSNLESACSGSLNAEKVLLTLSHLCILLDADMTDLLKMLAPTLTELANMVVIIVMNEYKKCGETSAVNRDILKQGHDTLLAFVTFSLKKNQNEELNIISWLETLRNLLHALVQFIKHDATFENQHIATCLVEKLRHAYLSVSTNDASDTIDALRDDLYSLFSLTTSSLLGLQILQFLACFPTSLDYFKLSAININLTTIFKLMMFETTISSRQDLITFLAALRNCKEILVDEFVMMSLRELFISASAQFQEVTNDSTETEDAWIEESVEPDSAMALEMTEDQLTYLKITDEEAKQQLLRKVPCCVNPFIESLLNEETDSILNELIKYINDRFLETGKEDQNVALLQSIKYLAPLSRKIDVLALKALLRMTPAENGNHWIILISLLDCQLSCADKEELVSSLVLDKLPMDLKFSFWIIKRQAEREEGIYEKMEEDVLDCLFGILPVPHADTKYCQKLLQLAASFVPIYREIIAQNFVDGSEIFLNYGLEECLLILDYLFDILGSDLMIPHLKEIKGDKNWKILLEFLGTALPKDFRDFLRNTNNVNKAICGEKKIIVKELFERTKMTSLNLKRFISYMKLPN